VALFWLDLEACIILLDDICNNVILFLNLLLLFRSRCSYSSGLYPPVSGEILTCSRMVGGVRWMLSSMGRTPFSAVHSCDVLHAFDW
jgi:hypothetical protein